MEGNTLIEIPKNPTLLIDADILIYRCCCATEESCEWGKTSNTDLAWYNLQSMIKKIEKDTNAKESIFCVSDHKENFRKSILSTYKANRKGNHRPDNLSALESILKRNRGTVGYAYLEADDVMGILATNGQYENPVMVSIDKDMFTVPGWHYNFVKESWKYITEEEAQYNLWFQTLIGDPSDGYKGCPGIGKKKAAKLLEDCKDETDYYYTVANQFVESSDFDDSVSALLDGTHEVEIQLSMARILTADTCPYALIPLGDN